MNKEKTYRYYLIYIKPEYYSLIPDQYKSSLNNSFTMLYAYTDNKKYLKKFLEYRNESYYYIIKKDLSREDINLLCKDYQNYIIRKKKVTSRYNVTKSYDKDFYITEKEHNITLNFIYHILSEDMWLLSYDSSIDIFTDEYKEILTTLRFNKLHDRLNEGNLNFSDFMIPDFIGSYVEIFKSILI